MACLCAAVPAAGCGAGGSAAPPVVLATTTSPEDSGLLDVLAAAFEAAAPYRLHRIVTGTGEALEIGRRGDADLVLVHAPAAESAFVAAGHGLERRPLMYNDFVIVGPAADPAEVRGLADAAAALRRIAAAGQPFVSRGDDSGTHMRELELWSALPPAERPALARAAPAAGAGAGGAAGGPRPAWYLDAGQGMGGVLLIASERRGYTLTDRSTLLYMRDRLRLEVLVEGDPRLRNPYAVIAVRRARNPEGARALIDWLTGPEGQRLIGEHGRDRFGEPLFVPDAAGTAALPVPTGATPD